MTRDLATENARHQQPRMAQARDQGENADSALLEAATRGDANALASALAAGARADAMDKWSLSAAMIAASGGHEGCLRILIAAGADIEARETFGRTALMHAAHFGKDKCALALIEAGASLRPLDQDGRAAPWIAADGGFADLAARLDALALARRERMAMGAACGPQRRKPESARPKPRL